MKTLLVTVRHMESTINGVKTGQNVRYDRTMRRLSLAFVARKMGISTSYLCDLELGRRHWTEALVARYQEAVK